MSDPEIDIDVYSQSGVTVSNLITLWVYVFSLLTLEQTYTIPGPAPWTG